MSLLDPIDSTPDHIMGWCQRMHVPCLQACARVRVHTYVCVCMCVCVCVCVRATAFRKLGAWHCSFQVKTHPPGAGPCSCLFKSHQARGPSGCPFKSHQARGPSGCPFKSHQVHGPAVVRCMALRKSVHALLGFTYKRCTSHPQHTYMYMCASL